MRDAFWQAPNVMRIGRVFWVNDVEFTYLDIDQIILLYGEEQLSVPGVKAVEGEWKEDEIKNKKLGRIISLFQAV